MSEDKVGRHVIVCTPVLLIGGTEIQTFGQVKALFAAGYRVTVCCYHEHDSRMAGRFEAAGAEVVLLNRDRSDGLLSLLRVLRRFFLERRPDAVHVQYVAPGFVPILAARLARAPVVLATVHASGDAGYGWKAKMLLRLAARMSDAFLCVSMAAERFWFGSAREWDEGAPAGRRHFAIPNGVDVERIAETAASADRTALLASFGIAGGPVVGFVGRLAPAKSLATLLHAMKRIAEVHPGVSLLVVGDGPELGAMKRLSEELGIASRIAFAGRVEPEQVPALYGAMDVLAVPSLYEGFGLVAAEAMAAGRPVVASDVEGLSEVVEDGVTGVLVRAGDSDALATALVQVLSDPGAARTLGQHGRARVEARYSLSRSSQALLRLYDRLLGTRRQ